MINPPDLDTNLHRLSSLQQDLDKELDHNLDIIQPIIYNDVNDSSSLRNIMLIDSNVLEAQLFYDSANSNTFPIKYFYTSKKTELLELFRNKFQNGIDRISFVFHDPSVLEKGFLDNQTFFNATDLLEGQTTFSENVLFLFELVKEFSITHFDFLACNTLKYDIWNKFYELLFRQSGVICGASNDATGNLQYGGDWTMESTNENIKNIYFNNNIDNYASSLVATTISNDGGIITIEQDSVTLELSYSINGGYLYPITDFPIYIENTTTYDNLTVEFTTDITINNVNAYFVCASSYITFDGGLYNVVTFSGVTGYLGLIQNGTSSTDGFHTITIENINTATSDSTLAVNGGWICQSYFGRNMNNISGFDDPLTNLIQIQNCNNSASINNTGCGGICGREAGYNGTVIISNCSNSGEISGLVAAGICGQDPSPRGGNMTITDCSNSGVISGSVAAGICGRNAGDTNGNVTISDCSNTGVISGSAAAGICGQDAGYDGNVTISDCSNTALISGSEAAGICGRNAGNFSGNVTITDCSNTGVISGTVAAGICGRNAGISSGNVTITGSSNTGVISGSESAGICGSYATNVTITNCSNTALISGSEAAGICGDYATNVTITNCSNTGAISGSSSSGICGPYATNVTITDCSNSGTMTDIYCSGICGRSVENVTITGCSNSGTMTGTYCSGICGAYARTVTITNCSNTGVISGSFTAGICGPYAGSYSSTVTITNCSNTGVISGSSASGICGPYAGFSNGTVTINKCYNTSDISSDYSGGITAIQFGFNTNQICSITDCYNTGSIGGTNSGGICGAEVGYNNLATGTSYTPQVNIVNCYTSGNIATTCGGILGGSNGNSYTNTPTVTLTNCYTSGTFVDPDSGLIADSLQIKNDVTVSHCYIAEGNWSDTDANAALTGEPLTNPGVGVTWASEIINTPYLLSSLTSSYIISDGGTVLFRAGSIEYSTDNGYTWTTVTLFPIYIENTSPTNEILTIEFTDGLTIDNVNAYFVCASSYITFDGLDNTVTFSGVTDYPGLIQNGTSSTDGFHTITIENINTTTSDSTLVSNSGWICQSYFGRNMNNISGFDPLTNLIQIQNCSNSASINNNNCGGICGAIIGYNGTVTISNCINSGTMNITTSSGICGPNAGESNGTVTITNCSNSGTMTGTYCSGICGAYAGYISGSVTISDCSNTGSLGELSSGICGNSAGRENGTVIITNCSNSGTMGESYSSGICGSNAGDTNGTVTISNCSNSSEMSSQMSSGICGLYAGFINGTVTISDCGNTGTISSTVSSGICGAYAGQNNGTVTISKCYNTSDISSDYSGGIASYWFGYNTDQLCSITDCYNTGLIEGTNNGGICGAEVGYNDLATGTSYTPQVNIFNCYTLGNIAATCGGILGGSQGNVYNNSPTVTLTNSYSAGSVSTSDSGLIAVSLQIGVTVSDCYIADGNWSDSNANAVLTGEPSSNPDVGETWTSVVINTPYLLSSYNNSLYFPSSISISANTYTTSDGLQENSTYVIINNEASSSTRAIVRIDSDNGQISYAQLLSNNVTIQTNVVAYNPGSVTNYYYGYNINSFTLTFAICFKEDTKILCLINNVEEYVLVQDIRPGTLVKTYKEKEKYVKVDTIGWFDLYNSGDNIRTLDGLYELRNENYSDLFEPLILTGRHSILVDYINKDDKINKDDIANKHLFKPITMLHDKYKFPCCVNNKANVYQEKGLFKIWTFCLNTHNPNKNFAVYANGLLVETVCKKRMNMMKLNLMN